MREQSILVKKISILRSLLIACFGLTIISFLIALAGVSIGQGIYSDESSLAFKLVLRFFSLDAEKNLPTLFSVMLLLFSSILFVGIAFVKHRLKEKFALHWLGLSLIFIGLAWDEAVQLHESLMDSAQYNQFLGSLGIVTSGAFKFSWVITGIVALAIFCTVYFKFFLFLPRMDRKRLAWAAFLYIGGALAIEMLSGFINETYTMVSYQYVLVYHLEELCEMMGLCLLIYFNLSYLSKSIREIKFIFDDYYDQSSQAHQ